MFFVDFFANPVNTEHLSLLCECQEFLGTLYNGVTGPLNPNFCILSLPGRNENAPWGEARMLRRFSFFLTALLPPSPQVWRDGRCSSQQRQSQPPWPALVLSPVVFPTPCDAGPQTSSFPRTLEPDHS